MSASQRDIKRLAQKELKDLGFYGGVIDGLWGKISEAAHSQYELSKAPKGITLAPPASDYYSVKKVFGEPCDSKNLTTIQLPYEMKLSWDKGVSINKVSCHRLIATQLTAALKELLEDKGLDWITEHGLDLYGGIYACRRIRGGQSTSKHSWGIAIDLNPDANGLRTPYQNGLQGKPGYATMPQEAIDIFKKHGFKNLGEAIGRDAMHFEYTR